MDVTLSDVIIETGYSFLHHRLQLCIVNYAYVSYVLCDYSVYFSSHRDQSHIINRYKITVYSFALT